SSALFSADTLLRSWQQADELLADFAALRRAGEHMGWALRRATEPLVLSGAVLPAIAYCMRDGQRVPLIPALASTLGVERVAAIAARMPLVAVADAESASTMSIPTLSYAKRGDCAVLPELLARAIGEVNLRAERDLIAAVFAEVRRSGVLTEPRLAERLGCDEDEVAPRLALPTARALRQASDVHYIEGFGLCTAETLARARAQ